MIVNYSAVKLNIYSKIIDFNFMSRKMVIKDFDKKA